MTAYTRQDLIDVDTGEEYLTFDEAVIETTEKRPEGR